MTRNIMVGNNSTIAAGSVAIADVPDNVVVAGNSAQIKKKNELGVIHGKT